MMRRVSIVRVAFALATVIAFGGVSAFADVNQSVQSKISNQVMVETTEGRQASFIVFMADQADVSAAYTIKDPDARGWYVYLKLKEHAEASQAAIRAQLNQAGAPYESFWAANMIVMQGGRDLVESMASRSDVAAIEPNSVVDAIRDDSGPETIDEGNEVAAAEVGLNNVKAPSLWNLGFKGQGMVIANQDTGMRWTHASLRTHYRGWISGTTADHNYNWFDGVSARITNADGGTPSGPNNTCGYNLQAPCADQGHGTHTTGTTVGDDFGAGIGAGTNQVGVAPAAKWIGCRNMDAGNGRASTYTKCFQFFLAPTNTAGVVDTADPAKRPHVMNNSWGCPQVGELCAPNVMKAIVENSEAAGIFVVASNGNDGPNCNTVHDPPGIYEATFSVGAISGTTNALQGFSSRGDVSADGSHRMKPDVSAPGASVRSSLRNNDTAYGSMSGTSMASPHVVGAVALLWSASPKLVRDVPRTKWVLTRGANTNVTVASNAAGCGGIGTIPNNHFGWGRIDVVSALSFEHSLDQTIDFPALADKILGDQDFDLTATASSGFPVRYSATGSCSVVGETKIHINGVARCTVTASQEGLDQYSIAANAPRPYYPATDVLRSFNVAYPFAGFFAPISNGTNSANAGSAIPIKFSLGGDRGTDIFAAGYPRSVAASCAGGAVTGAPDLATPPGNSGLKYDPTTAQYHYNWKSEKAWAGTCRALEVKFVDNTTHTAMFQFK